jgi:hypothetical protein
MCGLHRVLLWDGRVTKFITVINKRCIRQPSRLGNEAANLRGLTLDGQPLEGDAIPLTNDFVEHFVELRTK